MNTNVGINLMELHIDIQTNIFKLLSLKDIANLMLTCKYMKTIIIENGTLWRHFFRHQLIIENRKSDGYPDLLRYHACRISHNWCTGIYRSKSLIDHKINYMPWLKYNCEVLLLTVGSQLRCHEVDKHGVPRCNKSLWKLDVPIVKRNDIRTNDISRFVWKNNLLACGNRDGSIAIYTLSKIKKRPVLLQHIRNCHEDGLVEVSAVEVINTNTTSYIVTASDYSPHVMFWRRNGDHTEDDHNTHLEKYTNVALDKFEGARCLDVNSSGETLAIGPNGYNRPILLDVNTFKITSNLGETKRVTQVVRDIYWHDENTIAYVNHAGILQLIDTRCERVIYNARDPFHATLYCVKTDGNNAIVVGSSEFSRCVLFDRRSVNHVQMYFTQKKSSPVYCLDFNSAKLITAVDRSVAALNFNIFIGTSTPRDYSHIFHAQQRNLL